MPPIQDNWILERAADANRIGMSVSDYYNVSYTPGCQPIQVGLRCFALNSSPADIFEAGNKT